MVTLLAAPALTAQGREPLNGLVREALRNNLALQGERLAEDRTAAEVRARAYFFRPCHSLAVPRQSGALDLGNW
jgi:hypothetical protein